LPLGVKAANVAAMRAAVKAIETQLVDLYDDLFAPCHMKGS
jgi:hypothetical protein